MSNIKLFESKRIRSFWSEEEEKWYFSIVDVVGILTDSPNPNKKEEVALREPQQIVEAMKVLDEESAGILNSIVELI